MLGVTTQVVDAGRLHSNQDQELTTGRPLSIHSRIYPQNNPVRGTDITSILQTCKPRPRDHRCPPHSWVLGHFASLPIFSFEKEDIINGTYVPRARMPSSLRHLKCSRPSGEAPRVRSATCTRAGGSLRAPARSPTRACVDSASDGRSLWEDHGAASGACAAAARAGSVGEGRGPLRGGAVRRCRRARRLREPGRGPPRGRLSGRWRRPRRLRGRGRGRLRGGGLRDGGGADVEGPG